MIEGCPSYQECFVKSLCEKLIKSAPNSEEEKKIRLEEVTKIINETCPACVQIVKNDKALEEKEKAFLKNALKKAPQLPS